MSPRIALFAHDVVGAAIVDFLILNYSTDIVAVVLTDDSGPVIDVLDRYGVAQGMRLAWRPESLATELGLLKPDFFLLAWWPHIMNESLLSIPRCGVLNTHPSLLPHCRGKHPNFWSIVEERPFGVSIHYVNSEVDAGDIAFQVPIAVSWEDTGETLYLKAREEMIRLFIESYPAIREGRVSRLNQNLKSGSFHLARDLEPACLIDLDRRYTARELLNIIRARTFPPFYGARFKDATGEYKIHISIQRING